MDSIDEEWIELAENTPIESIELKYISECNIVLKTGETINFDIDFLFSAGFTEADIYAAIGDSERQHKNNILHYKSKINIKKLRAEVEPSALNLFNKH